MLANFANFKLYVGVKQNNMAGLYIHIPFCHTKCAYCDFYSTPHKADFAKYARALLEEFESRRYEINEPYGTVYLGGGTPSVLPIGILDCILGALPVSEASEITVEVNPEDITDTFAERLADSPINRVSMGVQSFSDKELAAVGRRHTAAQATDAIHILRKNGMANISIDLMYGLPEQTESSWEETVNTALELRPEHISAYTLMLEPGTRLWAMSQAGKFTPHTDETISRMYTLLCDALAEKGYVHYEISNFALPGCPSLHNSSYWAFTPYLGLGPGAHSFDGHTRRYNPWNVKTYMESPTTFTKTESETTAELTNDYIMVRLRTASGLSLDDLIRRFGHETYEKVISQSQPHIRSGTLVSRNHTLSIPEPHFLISDSIICDILI